MITDTPRTDAAAFEAAQINPEGRPYEDSDGRSTVVVAEFARQLERENDALRRAGRRALVVLLAEGHREEPGNVLNALSTAIAKEKAAP